MLLGQAVDKYFWYAENVRYFSKATIKSRRIYLGKFLDYCQDKRDLFYQAARESPAYHRIF